MESIESWQVEGNAAEVYESRLVPAIFVPWATVVIEKANLQLGESVLDVACGTGVVARNAALAVGTTGKGTQLIYRFLRDNSTPSFAKLVFNSFLSKLNLFAKCNGY